MCSFDNLNITIPPKSSGIIIYGAGEVGVNAAISLIQNGYEVVCFLDRKREGIEEITGIQIIKLDTIDNKNIDRGNIVIVALADGIAHKRIADLLYSYGFVYFILLPMEFSMDQSIKNKYTHLYNMSLNGHIDMDSIIEYDSFIRPTMDPLESVAYEDKLKDEIIVWTRPELLYSERLDLWRGDKSKVHSIDDDQDINVAAYLPFIQLNKHLEGELDDCPLNWESFGRELTCEEKHKELIERETLLRVFENEYSRGMDFFVAGAPLAIWNDNRWNLHGGHHRTVFLVYKGHRMLPIRVSRVDYEKWVNASQLDQIRRYVIDNRIFKVNAPILHPAFMNFNVRREVYSHTVLDSVFCFLRERKERIDSAIDFSDMEGFFARAIARTSNQASYFITDNDGDIGFADRINQLEQINNVCCRREIKTDRMFDAGFAISLQINDRTRAKRIVLKLKRFVRKYVFIEVNTNVDMEILCENNGVVQFELLHKELLMGNMYATYVLWIA